MPKKNNRLAILLSIPGAIIGALIMIYLFVNNSNYINNLKNIESEKNYDLEINNAYNERGIYILNNKYYVNSSTFIIGNHYGASKDNAIWRPKNTEYKARISDISAPFKLSKKANSDTIKLIKGDKSILLLLNQNE